MNTYIIRNPLAFIGYWIVKAKNEKDAREVIGKYLLRKYTHWVDDPGFSGFQMALDVTEIAFDKDGIFADLEMLE